MNFLERRSSAAPAYNKPVNSRQVFKLVEETTVQCDANSNSSRSTDDGEEYVRFHQYCGLPGEELHHLRPRKRPMKFTTRNRLSSSAIPTTPHALSLYIPKESVSVKSSSTGSSVVGWFQRLKDKMRGKKSDGKKTLKTFFDLSHFNKKKMRRPPPGQTNPTAPDIHTIGNPSRISSIRSAIATLARKAKETFPPIANRLQRKATQPAKIPRSRKEAIAARLSTGKRRPTTAVTYEAPKLLTFEAPNLIPGNTRSTSHMRNISDGTTVSSFLGSERSDESTSTAPTSVMSTSAAEACTYARPVNQQDASSEQFSASRYHSDPKNRIAGGVMNELPSWTKTSISPEVRVAAVWNGSEDACYPAKPTPRHASAALVRVISTGKPDAAPPIITATRMIDDNDTHVRTKPLGFKRTRQRISRFRESLSPYTSAPAINGGASAGSSVTSFDQPMGSHLPVSTPHARIASVSHQLKERLGFGGSQG